MKHYELNFQRSLDFFERVKEDLGCFYENDKKIDAILVEILNNKQLGDRNGANYNSGLDKRQTKIKVFT